MSEMWEPPIPSRIFRKDRNVSLHITNKNINNKATWTYSTNDYQFPFIFIVKICHWYSYIISWSYWNIAWFNEENIVLWPIIWYYTYCGNMITQRIFIMKKKIPTHPLVQSTTPLVYILKYQHMWLWDVNPRNYVSEVTMFWLPIKREGQESEKLLLFNDDIEIG